jgi:hypothetical protein
MTYFFQEFSPLSQQWREKSIDFCFEILWKCKKKLSKKKSAFLKLLSNCKKIS